MKMKTNKYPICKRYEGNPILTGKDFPADADIKNVFIFRNVPIPQLFFFFKYPVSFFRMGQNTHNTTTNFHFAIETSGSENDLE